MGACASRPKDLDTEEAPLPVEKVEEQQTVPQENNTETEAAPKNEEPLVEVSEPAPEAPKFEEVDSTEEQKPEAKPEATNDQEAVAEEVSKVSTEETQNAPHLL